MMTAAAIREQLERTYSITVDRNGTEFFISEDEGGNGWYAWRTPIDEGAIGDKEFDAEVDYPDGLLGTPDFGPLSEEIAAWIAKAYP